jgi:Protein of unknown function (DUF1161)
MTPPTPLRLARGLACAALAAAGSAHAAGNCDAIRAQIDAKIRASGVSTFSLQVVDAEDRVAGKVVGSCDRGTKKIVYATKSAPAAPRGEALLTECRDGSVRIGGDCPK